MRIKQALFIGTLLLASSFSVWLFFHTPHQHKQSDLRTTPYSIAFAKNVAVTRMDKNGKLQSQLYSPKMTQYIDGTTQFENPHFVVYSHAGQPWDVTADHGKAFDGIAKVILWGNVTVKQSAGTKNNPMTITTTTVTVYPKQQFAETDQPVTFIQPGIVIHSVGARAYLQEGRVELLSKARGQYDPKKS